MPILSAYLIRTIYVLYVHVLSACINRVRHVYVCARMKGGKMNSRLEFAAREKVNQLAVLANFSSQRGE